MFKDNYQIDTSRRTILKFTTSMVVTSLIGCGNLDTQKRVSITCGDNLSKNLLSNIINWDDGRLINISRGKTATCSALKQGQLYVVFLYNDSNNDHDVDATIVWSNIKIPVLVNVPGTLKNKGAASIVLVSGNDTTTISVSVTHTSSGSIETYIGSVGMPSNTSGLNNRILNSNGISHPFTKNFRYYTQPIKAWYQLTIENKIEESFVIQLRQHKAIIYIINPTVNVQLFIKPLGSVILGRDYFIKKPSNDQPPQYITAKFQGNDSQIVWMTLNGKRSNQNQFITLQKLSTKNTQGQNKCQ